MKPVSIKQYGLDLSRLMYEPMRVMTIWQIRWIPGPFGTSCHSAKQKLSVEKKNLFAISIENLAKAYFNTDKPTRQQISDCNKAFSRVRRTVMEVSFQQDSYLADALSHNDSHSLISRDFQIIHGVSGYLEKEHNQRVNSGRFYTFSLDTLVYHKMLHKLSLITSMPSIVTERSELGLKLRNWLSYQLIANGIIAPGQSIMVTVAELHEGVNSEASAQNFYTGLKNLLKKYKHSDGFYIHHGIELREAHSLSGRKSKGYEISFHGPIEIYAEMGSFKNPQYQLPLLDKEASFRK